MRAPKIETIYALIYAGVVENMIVADAAFAAAIAPNYDAVVIANGTPAYIGGAYVNGAFVPAPPVEEPPAA